MAHYALINADNVVVQVITGVDEDVTQIDSDGTIVGGSTEAWEEFYQTRPWFQGLYCKRTSYNNRFRKQYAGIGYTYDSVNDIFIEAKPYPSWVLDDDFEWQAPVPRPTIEGVWEWQWYWNEDTLSWVQDIRE